MTEHEIDRIQNAINHIKSATDVDPWAVEIAVRAMEKELKNSSDGQPEHFREVTKKTNLISRQAVRYIESDSKYEGDWNQDYEDGFSDALEKVLVLPPAQPEIIRCKDCKWFGDIGCAIKIVDDSDKPTENDFCSFAERKADG